jgi:hypothetical protein
MSEAAAAPANPLFKEEYERLVKQNCEVTFSKDGANMNTW